MWVMNENAKQNQNQCKLFIKPFLWKCTHWIEQDNLCNNGFRNNLHWTICMCFSKEAQRFWINLIFLCPAFCYSLFAPSLIWLNSIKIQIIHKAFKKKKNCKEFSENAILCLAFKQIENQSSFQIKTITAKKLIDIHLKSSRSVIFMLWIQI